MPRPSKLIVAVALLPIALVGCGADPGSPPRVAAADGEGAPPPIAFDVAGLPVELAIDKRGETEVEVQVKDNSYTVKGATEEETRVIRVDPGTRVTFVNDGANPHNVTPFKGVPFEEIPTGRLDPKQTASLVFPAAGLYPYYCSIHGTQNKGQRGLVVAGRLRVVRTEARHDLLPLRRRSFADLQTRLGLAAGRAADHAG